MWKQRLNAAITVLAVFLSIVIILSSAAGFAWLLVTYGEAWMLPWFIGILIAAVAAVVVYRAEMRDLKRGDGIEWIK